LHGGYELLMLVDVVDNGSDIGQVMLLALAIELTLFYVLDTRGVADNGLQMSDFNLTDIATAK
jgi:hypothetical protein